MRGNRALLVLWGDVNSKDIDESALNDWWTNEHLPERLSIPGFLRARRYYARDELTNTTFYLTLYEVADLSILTSPAYMEKLNNPTTRTRHHIPTLATMHRSACEVFHFEGRPEFLPCRSYLGAGLAMIVCHLPHDNAIYELLDSMVQALSKLQTVNKDIVCFRILQENRAATEPGSSSQSYKDVKVGSNGNAEGTRCIVLVEFSSPPYTDARTILEHLLSQLRSRSEENGGVTLNVYNLMCSLSN